MEKRVLKPVGVATALRECPGKWVAIKCNEIVEVQETPDQLTVALKSRGIRGAIIMRAPSEGEAELVGLG